MSPSLSEQPAVTAKTESSECPRCKSLQAKHVTDCFGTAGDKICELWYCMQCHEFFPDDVAVDPPAGGEKGGPERRRHSRFNVQFIVQVLFSDKYSEPRPATAVNASAGGICFLFPEPIAEGTEGALRISLPSVTRSFDVLGRVVGCNRVPDGDYGIRVCFKLVDPKYQAALERYVKSTGMASNN